jgi:hypothetical protein
MVKIDRYRQFSVEDTLYVFDFDDTLFVTPKWEDIAKKIIFENLTPDQLVKRALRDVNIDKTRLKTQDGRIFFEDPNLLSNITKDWTRKGSRVYLVQPPEFCYLDQSLPNGLKNISEIYKGVKNKCIVTARPESVRPKIEGVLQKFDLEYPKWGLHMCPEGRMNAGRWKGEKICELAKTTGFQNITFYDDNSKYIREAKKVVSEKMPNLNFKCIKVS